MHAARPTCVHVCVPATGCGGGVAAATSIRRSAQAVPRRELTRFDFASPHREEELRVG